MTSTRVALIDAGVALMAERGFADVSVGDIEEAAGFARRGGTLYKHFDSKLDLLTQAMQHHVDSLERSDDLDGFADLPDQRSELVVLARWILRRLDREEAISKVIEKDGHRLPDLIAQMRHGISEAGYTMFAAYLRDRALPADLDAEALAVLLLGSLVNVRRSTWTSVPHRRQYLTNGSLRPGRNSSSTCCRRRRTDLACRMGGPGVTLV